MVVEQQRNRLRKWPSAAQIKPVNITAPSPSPVQQPVETKRRYSLPPWDRTVDAVYHRYKRDEKKPKRKLVSQESVDRFFLEHGRARDTAGYFRLPHDVRLRICQDLVCDNERTRVPITLNRPCFNKDCWGSSDFIALHDALLPFQPYLKVSFDFYADMLLLFLAKHTFHVVFSPYVRSALHPLATTWLNKYASYINNIIVEVDMTKLALGPELHAARLLPCMGHLDNLLHDFTSSLLLRDAGSPLRSLIVLCRRFFGERGEAEVKDSCSLRARSRTSSFRVQSPDSGMTKFSLEKVKEVEENDELGGGRGFHEDSNIFNRSGVDKVAGLYAGEESYNGDESGPGEETWTKKGNHKDAALNQSDHLEYNGTSPWFADITRPTSTELSNLNKSLFTNHDSETGYPQEEYALLVSILNRGSAQRPAYTTNEDYIFVTSPMSNESVELQQAENSDDDTSTCTSVSSMHSSQLQFTEYCPDEYLHICNHLLLLSGLVDSARLCGFSERYTHDFIVRLFPSARSRSARNHCYRVAPSTLWPRLPNQRSWVDVGYGQLVVDDHEQAVRLGIMPQGPIQLRMPSTDSGAAAFLSADSDLYSMSKNPNPEARSCTSFSGRKTSHSALSSTDTLGVSPFVDSDGKSVVQRFLERCKPRDKTAKTLLRKALATL